jgi:hypothetical protein
MMQSDDEESLYAFGLGESSSSDPDPADDSSVSESSVDSVESSTEETGLADYEYRIELSESESTNDSAESTSSPDTDEEREIRLNRPEMVYPQHCRLDAVHPISRHHEVYINDRIYAKCCVSNIYYDATSVELSYYELENLLMGAGIIRPFLNLFTEGEVLDTVEFATPDQLNQIGHQLAYSLIIGCPYTVIQYKREGGNLMEKSRFHATYMGFQKTDWFFREIQTCSNRYLFYDGWKYYHAELEAYNELSDTIYVILENIHQHLKNYIEPAVSATVMGQPLGGPVLNEIG